MVHFSVLIKTLIQFVNFSSAPINELIIQYNFDRENSADIQTTDSFTYSREMAMKFKSYDGELFFTNVQVFYVFLSVFLLLCIAGENKKEIYELLIFKHRLHSPVIIIILLSQTQN